MDQRVSGTLCWSSEVDEIKTWSRWKLWSGSTRLFIGETVETCLKPRFFCWWNTLLVLLVKWWNSRNAANWCKPCLRTCEKSSRVLQAGKWFQLCCHLPIWGRRKSASEIWRVSHGNLYQVMVIHDWMTDIYDMIKMDSRIREHTKVLTLTKKQMRMVNINTFFFIWQ